MLGGYPTQANILALLAARGIEVVTDNNSDYIAEFNQLLYRLLMNTDWASPLAVYCPSTTTYNVVGGSYLYKGDVKTYTPGTHINPTDNDTTYLWMNTDNTLGAAIDGTGWPATEHIKLAEIDVDANGIITAIRDLRSKQFMNYAGTLVESGGATAQFLAPYFNSATPADNDEMQIPFYGKNDAGEKIEYARLTVKLTDVSDGTENAQILLSTIAAGVLTSIGDIVGSTATQTLTNKTLTAPDINGGTADALTSLGIRSSGTGAYDVTIVNTENLTAARILTVKLNNANRSIDIAGDIALAGGLATSGAYAVTLTLSGATNVTLPTSGTLIAQAGAAADGRTAANVSSNGGLTVIFEATIANGNTVQIHNANAPFKYRIIDAWALNTSADGGTWKVTNGTNDIVAAVTAAATDKLITRAATIDDAYHEIAANGSLSVVGDGSTLDAKVYVRAMRVA